MEMLIKKKMFMSLVVALISAFGASFYFKPSNKNTEIKDFDKQRDTEFVLDGFKRDMYWLVENPEFSTDFMIENMSPNKDPQYFGKLNFKVLFENNKPVGFTTFYKVKFYEGKIQFIYVHPDFRNKGYAKQLVKYATNALFNMGVSIVKLDTRVNNAPAIKAYEKAGFKIVSDDGKFVSMQISKN